MPGRASTSGEGWSHGSGARRYLIVSCCARSPLFYWPVTANPILQASGSLERVVSALCDRPKPKHGNMGSVTRRSVSNSRSLESFLVHYEKRAHLTTGVPNEKARHGGTLAASNNPTSTGPPRDPRITPMCLARTRPAGPPLFPSPYHGLSAASSAKLFPGDDHRGLMPNQRNAGLAKNTPAGHPDR